jgi:glucosyl-dolichyl phosphate glucuronosyltransferase
VVISTRNRAGWLVDCLRSLAEQDCDVPFEVVVIDNGSADETPLVLREWCDTHDGFRTAREERAGLSAGKNRGILLAAGATILFTDDDVVVDRSWISSYLDFFTRHQGETLVAGGRIAPVPDDLGPWPRWFGDAAFRDLGLLDHERERVLARGEYVWGANMAVPSALFDRFGLWDETVGHQGEDRGTFEDAEYQDRLRAGGVEVWFWPGAAIQHRVDRSRITPRHVVENAFSRGRNDFMGVHLGPWGGDPRSWPRRNLFAGLLDLGGNLARWGCWTIIFRMSPSERGFSRSRRAAYASGWSLESLRGGRGRSFHVIGRGALLARASVLRVSIDRP